MVAPYVISGVFKQSPGDINSKERKPRGGILFEDFATILLIWEFILVPQVEYC